MSKRTGKPVAGPSYLYRPGPAPKNFSTGTGLGGGKACRPSIRWEDYDKRKPPPLDLPPRIMDLISKVDERIGLTVACREATGDPNWAITQEGYLVVLSEIAAFYQEGSTLNEIAKELGLFRREVSELLAFAQVTHNL